MNVSLPTPVSTSALPGRPPDVPAGRHSWRVGVISNPLSGGNRRRGLGAIRRCLQRYPDVPHREVRNVPDVQAALDDFATRDLNLVVVNSGDGTVQAVLTALMAEPRFAALPLLALLNGGTTNMTHQDLGVEGPVGAALKRVMNWAYHGDGEALIRRQTILKVQTAECARPLYGLFFGAACIFNGIRFFHSRIHRTGLSGDAAHVLIIARFLWALARRDDALVAPLRARIQTDRFAIAPRSYLLLLVTSLDRLIMGLRPFQRPGEGPLRLTAVGDRPRHLLRALPFLVRGRPDSFTQPERGYLNCSARHIRLDMDGGFAVDGELFKAGSRRGAVLIADGGQADFLRL